MALSERQIAAAHRLHQDVCVVAGPGSGKTSVLIERFYWLVRERGVSPRRILAITFTDKAATEIRQRMLKAFAQLPRMRSEIERAWVSTIHSFCSRLLRENAIEAGIDPGFTVLEQSRLVLQDVADEVLETRFAADPLRMRRFLRSLAVAQERDGFIPDLATSLVDIYDAARLAGVRPAQLRRATERPCGGLAELRTIAGDILGDKPGSLTQKQETWHAEAIGWAESVLSLPSDSITAEHLRLASKRDWHLNGLKKGSAAHRCENGLRTALKELRRDWVLEYYVHERQLIVELLEQIDHAYRQRKRRASMLDFDDLEESAIELLETDEALRNRVAESFDHILMDELQDTNPLQWRLLELVRRPDRFFAVGDLNQSIYGFRHARPELFGSYRQKLLDDGKHVDELRDNYRTRPALLAVVNRLFEQAPGVEPHSLVSGKPFAPKPMESVEVIAAFGEAGEETEWIEAQWVARRILELVGSLPVRDRTADFADVAILTRANSATGELQRALDRFGIPSVVVGGVTFYETREVRDLKLVLDVLVNPRNEIALAGLLRSPVFGLTDEDLMQLCGSGCLTEAVERNPPQGWDLLLELRRVRNTVSPDRLLRRLMDACDYENGLTDRARSNVGKFLAMLRERYERNPVGLAELVTAVEQASPDAEAPPADAGNVVRLMTLHKAKGLEFPIVFIPYLHKGRNYGTPVISWTHEAGLGVKWRNPAGPDNISDSVARCNEEAARKTEEAEENRLLYVGCTRAEEHLVLSWSSTGRNQSCAAGFIRSRLGLNLDASEQTFTNGGVRVFTTTNAPGPVSGVASRARTANVLIAPVLLDQNSADSSASVTDISTFADCPRRYMLERWLRTPERGPSPHLLGASEEDLLDDEFPSFPAAEPGAARIGVQVHALLAGQEVADPAPEAVELAGRFREMPLYRKLRRARRKEQEWDFVFETGGLVLRGQVDLWFEYDRDLYLVDFKTDREPAQSTLDAHSLQLRLYALALERAVRRLPSKGFLCFLRLRQELEVDLSPIALGEALEIVHSFREAQRTGEFTVKPGEACRNCAFYAGACSVGRAKAVSG